MNTALTTADLAAAEKAPAGDRVDRVDRVERVERVEPKAGPTESAAAPTDVRRKSVAEDDELAPLFSSEMTKDLDRKSTRLNSSHITPSRMPSSA